MADLVTLVAEAHGRGGGDDGEDGRQDGRGDVGRGQAGVPLAPPPELLVERDRSRADRPVLDEPLQLGGHLLGAPEPVARVLGEGLEDDRLQVAGNASLELPRRRRSIVLDLANQLELVLSLERRAQGQQLVERRAECVEVALGIRDAAEPLGGHVPEGSGDVRLREVVPFLELGQAEVGDPDVPQHIQDQVRRLDVTMQDAPLVSVSQGAGDLGAQPGDFAIIASVTLADQGAG